MNILTGVGIGAKIGCGIGASRIASQACRTIMPPATNIGIKVCQELGAVAISGVVVDMVSEHIDKTMNSIIELSDQIRKNIKQVKEVEIVE